MQLFESAEKSSHQNSDLQCEEIAAVAPIWHIDDGSLLSAVHPGQPLSLFLVLKSLHFVHLSHDLIETELLVISVDQALSCEIVPQS